MTSPSPIAERRNALTPGLILPLIAVLAVSSFYPDVAASYLGDGWGAPADVAVTPETWTYLGLVGLQLALGAGLLCWFWPVYRREFPLRFSIWGPLVGGLGVVVWVALAQPGWEGQLWQRLGWDTSRPGFNPFSIADPAVRAGFLALRFALLVILIPLAEELFLRGWLLRWMEDPEYQGHPLADLTWRALPTAAVYGVLTHPGEALAAVAWFSLVTWLMWRTGSLWDCVVAHATTNLLLGLYILYAGQWQLW